jgi:Na+/melibiose symporter-like transporter
MSDAIVRRSEVETDAIVAKIRDGDERRKAERFDHWILIALIVVALIALLTTDQKRWPFLSSTFLTAGVLFRLVWATRRRGGPPDSD